MATFASLSPSSTAEAELLTSFSNPNYQLEDALNSNIVGSPLSRPGSSAATVAATSDLPQVHKTDAERGLARQLTETGGTQRKSVRSTEDTAEDMPESCEGGASSGQRSIEHVSSLSSLDINSPDSNDSGIHCDTGQSSERGESQEQHMPQYTLEPEHVVLPPGWEQHTDESGPYFWHVKTGVIQREIPEFSEVDLAALDKTEAERSDESEYGATLLRNESESRPTHIRFAVRSLGWVRIAEEELTPERSSKAVNRCIVDLSQGRHDINDSVGRWGDGKDLYLELDDYNLTLLEPSQLVVLNCLPISSIRVWGVGRDNGRDFAYVARDKVSRKHMCHVFRCDSPARQIANALRDICRQIMQERNAERERDAAAPSAATRPGSLPVEAASLTAAQAAPALFPTPIAEPKKTIKCHYVGSIQVPRPTGVDVLNGAIERLFARVQPEQWTRVQVLVAPSTITVSEQRNPENVLLECRVRYLSFMGIAIKNVKLMGFILHTAQNIFVAHVFHSDPSAGALCKTVEAACKLRYQKCLDAHQQHATPPRSSTPQGTQQSKSLGASLKQGVQSIVGLLKGKRVES